MVSHLLFWGDIMKIFNSTKHLVSFVFVAFYFIFNIINALITFSKFSNLLNSLISLIPSALILFYLIFEYKDFKLNKHIFKLVFGIIAFRNLYTVTVSIIGTPQYLLFANGTIVLFVFSLLLLLFNILCFCGTLLKFRFLFLFKIGCIGYILTTIIMQVYEFVLLGGMDYINSVPKEMLPINNLSLIKLLSIILFYVGIFILTTNKKDTDLVW